MSKIANEVPLNVYKHVKTNNYAIIRLYLVFISPTLEMRFITQDGMPAVVVTMTPLGPDQD